MELNPPSFEGIVERMTSRCLDVSVMSSWIGTQQKWERCLGGSGGFTPVEKFLNCER